MRVGVFWVFDCYPELGQSPDRVLGQVLDQTEAAEAAGFDGCWYAEHHFSLYGVCPAPAVVLAAAAQRTSRVRLGVAVSVLPLADPIRVAEQYALVDVLSQGRLEMGVGSGYLPPEFLGFGVPFDEKRDRFDEALAVLPRLWSGEAVTYAGQYYRVDGVRLNALPVQRPHPPIWVAAGRVAALRHLAAKGLPIMIIPYAAGLPDPGLRDAIELFRASGGPPRVAAAYHALAAPTEGEAYDLMRPALRRYLETRGADAPGADAVLGQEFVVWGDPERCLARLRRLREVGVTDVLLLASFGGLLHRAVLRSLDLLGREVLGRLRADPVPSR